MADRQAGRISRGQLLWLGTGPATVDRWLSNGYLQRQAPGVMSVGHAAPSIEAELWTAVLYAGPGAALSHGTGAWWQGWLERPVAMLHVSTPRQRASLPGIVVHGRRSFARRPVRGIPVTAVARTIRDLAAAEPVLLVRKALAELDYRGELDRAALLDACGRGRAGSAALIGALAMHMPELARVRSRLETAFLLLCERNGIPIPLVNRKLYGVRADMWWPQHRLVVELDGIGAHRSPERIRRDRRNELTLRAHGILTVRYDGSLLDDRPLAVRDDLLATIAARAAS